MDQNQKPHSRQKTVGSGSVDANKGREVNTGSRPVGSGGRTPQSGGRASFSPQSGNQQKGSPAGLRLSPKSLLLIIVVVVIIIFAMKMMGGGSGDTANIPDLSVNNQNTGYSSNTAGNSSQQNTQADLTVSSLAREKRVVPVGDGKDIVTIMVYMCGTDLESKYGMATSDLQEMLNATISEKVNLIVMTGGCSKWKNGTVSNAKNQIYKVEDEGLRLLVEDAGTAAMTNPKNLTNFIKFCTSNFEADRNMLILWDHGGGSVTGYGYDEKNPGSSSMTLSMIDSALEEAECTFDWIGFDACLMATLETALVCNSYSDYLLASEETEPGTGWQYTGWLTELSKNTSKPTVEIAQIIIDDFVSASRKAQANAQVTLSIMDLAELQGTVPETFSKFAASTGELLKSDNYKQVSDARAGVRQFAQSNRINQVDLVDLALRIDTNDSRNLADALQNCVKYNKSTISRCYGVSIFFPYENTKSVKNAIASYNEISADNEYSSCMKEYTNCIQSFASLECGGQIAASATQSPLNGMGGTDILGSLLSAYAGSGGTSTSPLSALMGSFSGTGSSGSATSSAAGFSVDPATILSLLSGFSGRSMPAEYDWIDTRLIADHADALVINAVDPSHITSTEKDGKKVLSLSEEEWSNIQTVELNVFVQDGDGYIDLGLDNTFEWYGDDLLLEYDGTWLTINGNLCAYYLVSDTEMDDGSWVTIGRIPALLNNEFVNLMVVFDSENPQGIVTGAYPLYADGETDVLAKGDIAINVGDNIELLCDYYDLDGTYSASYTLGTSFTVPQSGLKLENLKVNARELDVTYRFTDVFGNHFWLPING